MSVIFGYLAYESSQSSADRRWFETYSPSYEVWAQSVRQAGWILARDPVLTREIVASLPVLGEAFIPSEVYWSENPPILVVREIQNDSGESHLIAGLPDTSVQPDHAFQWEHLGASWRGWDESIKRIRGVSIPQAFTKAPKKRTWSDPREIHY